MSERYAGARIGIDLDNTLISYDRLFLELALERGLVPPDFRGTKKEIRDRVRLLPDGELAWRHLQAQAYGPAIGGAQAADGVCEFIARARGSGAELAIVSHKTAYSEIGAERVNLRDAARGWLRERGIVGPQGIPEDNVHFEPTRRAKIMRIKALGCTHFIDDLEEVLGDASFPASVERMLLGAASERARRDYRAFGSFREIADVFTD